MTHTTPTDMARFYQRYDRRHRLVFVAALSASLVMSAVTFAHGLPATAAPGANPGAILWGLLIVFPPQFIVAWWGAMELIARWRDGRPAMTADDTPNGLRIAHAGFAYSVALTAAALGSQAVGTLTTLGHPVGDLVPRATTVAVGAALLYLGNLWPRLPTPRTPERKAAATMKINRAWGWLMVIMGLSAVLLGLFPSLFHPWLGHRP